MSGGRWEYVQNRVRDGLLEVAHEPQVEQRFTALARVLELFAEQLYTIIKQLDWDLSSDTWIPDDREFEHRALEMLRKTLQS